MPSPLPSPSLTLTPTPLTPQAFAPFGHIITSPLPATTTTIPSSPPQGSTFANQTTALKYPHITPLKSTYHLSPSQTPALPAISLISCFPRALRRQNGHQIFDLHVLERHPYTTQTFLPLSCPPGSKFVVIVAPTLPTPKAPLSGTPYFPQSVAREEGLPDLANVKAFVGGPGVGVTYGVGVWHAPMVVVGEGRVDFVVSQWSSGRGEEDCVEVDVGRGVEVLVGGERAEL